MGQQAPDLEGVRRDRRGPARTGKWQHRVGRSGEIISNYR